jgi:hypothetical protein
MDKWISFSISILFMSMVLIALTNDGNKDQERDAFAQTKNSYLWIFPYSRSRTYEVRLISTFVVFFLLIILVMVILLIGGAGPYYHFDSVVFGLMIIPCSLISLMCSSISIANSSRYRKGFYYNVLGIFLLNIINIFATYVAFKEPQIGMPVMVTWSIITVLLAFYVVKASYNQYLKMDFISSDMGYTAKKSTKIDIYDRISSSKNSMVIWNLVEKRMIIFPILLIAFFLLNEFMHSYFFTAMFNVSFAFILMVYVHSVVRTQKNITREIIFSILPYSRKDVFKIKLISFMIVLAIMEILFVVYLSIFTHSLINSLDFYQSSAFLVSTFLISVVGFCFYTNKVMHSGIDEGLTLVMLIILLMIVTGLNISIANHMMIYIIGIASQIILAAYCLKISMKHYVTKDIVG